MDNGSFVALVASFAGVFMVCNLILIICSLVKNDTFSAVEKKRGFKFNRLTKTLTISATAQSINYYLLSKCKDIISIQVQENNAKFIVKNNCLIDQENKTLVVGCKNSEIPNNGSVETIGCFAFYKCEQLSRIVIPETVVKIDKGAFRLCEEFTRIIYQGTQNQWQEIQKDPSWNSNCGLKKIVCTDGVINI